MILQIAKTEYKNILWITLGSFIFVLGVNLFLTPVGIYTTGMLGLSQEISTLSNLAFNTPDLTSIIFLLLNIPAILLGWFKVGKKFTFRTFYAIILISFYTTIIPNDQILITDDLLSVITSGLFMGAGVGINLKFGSSSGGTDIIALFVSLTKGKGFGIYNIGLNLIVIILAVFLSKDFTMGILMLILIYTVSIVIDKVHNSHEKLTLFIVTNNTQAIKQSLLNNYVRGLTIIDSQGGMSGSKNNTIMFTISKGELYSVIETIKQNDSKAFINIYNVERVVGYFENNYKNIL